MSYIRWFAELDHRDVFLVGGKNASLAEMHRYLTPKGVKVLDGFATTADAYRAFLKENELEEPIAQLLKESRGNLKKRLQAGKTIRGWMMRGQFSSEFEKEICLAYRKLCKEYQMKEVDVAVRSSATAEDLPTASFAGQQASFLNVRGEKALIKACKGCFASLFTDRAISYREEKGFEHSKVALSVGIQKMVRADSGSSGVLFTLDTESGFPDLVMINAAFGLGENVVQGAIEPDEYRLFKPFLDNDALLPIIGKKLGSKTLKMIYTPKGTKNVATSAKESASWVLSEKEIIKLARWALEIERHYKQPMDIEWAKDGRTDQLFIVQARPETVQSRKKRGVFKTYHLEGKGPKLVSGMAIGEAIAVGRVQVMKSIREIKKFKPGSILVTPMTSPDWVPIMKQAAGIITDHGGRTSHAAIVSRELSLPAIVGTGDATSKLKNGQMITLSCAEGTIGTVYQGQLSYKEEEIDIAKLPKPAIQLMLNLASPEEALRWWHLPVQGVGLARMEFIINQVIRIHPMALVKFQQVKDAQARRKIETLTKNYARKTDYFVELLARGIGTIAAAQFPHPVIVRMSDFKTNEYADLIGGRDFEPKEENPMLGFRGASRYYSPRYRAGFALECRAIKMVREKMGFYNVKVMIPFCRTLEEADLVLGVMAQEGLERHKERLEVYVMCEVPSNVVLAESFANKFDGFSIGSNDLTQLVLGVDRDAADLAQLFDERNEAVKTMIADVIKRAKNAEVKVGICGQAPSDYPDFAEFLIHCGIDSISLNPDSVIPLMRHLNKTTAVAQEKALVL